MKKSVCYLVRLTLLNIIFSLVCFSQKSEFSFDFNNTNKLPALIIDLDEDDIANAYSFKKVITSTGFSDDNNGNQYHSELYKTDEKIYDAINLFRRYITEELLQLEKFIVGFNFLLLK
jgi:hypothetical protein